MPIIVDHGERRTALCALAAEIIAAEGLDFATVRRIAHEAGYSTKVVSHYFPDKRMLMLATYRYAADQSSALAEATQRGGADIGRFATSLLPIGKTMFKNWKVWLAFWSIAISDKDFAAEQRRQVRHTRKRLTELLAQNSQFAHLVGDERQAVARALLTQIIGISLQAVFDPQDWSKERQVNSIAAALVPSRVR